MIILIPLGGTGERFKCEGYDLPKGLINVNEKPIIFHLLDNLNLTNEEIEFVYIPYNKEYAIYDFENRVQTRYPNIKFYFCQLLSNTRGAVETINIALKHLIDVNVITKNKDTPLLTIDGDNYYKQDIISSWTQDNTIFTFYDNGEDAKYSYVETNNNIITKIVEKEKMSDKASCGAYGFKSVIDVLTYSDYIISNNIVSKNEFYVSTLIQEMITKNHIFTEITVFNKHYYSLGTPSQIHNHKCTLLFDLDGTLVNTDNIYCIVWQKIFKQYNIGQTIDKHFFNFFIRGKSDVTFLKYLIPDINENNINEISILKDKLFIQELTLYESNILIPGAIEFIEKHKNCKMAIVTNSNKSAATEILRKTKLNEYISLLITSEDTLKNKPSPEPYLKAINILSATDDRIIIFEDSYSGYKSARDTNKGDIVLVCNSDLCEELQHTKTYKIKNYLNLSIDDIIVNHSNQNSITSLLKKSLKYMPIKAVEIISEDIKTGYICDIQLYNLKYINNTNESVILKINNVENELAITAEKLHLYKNEEYFYKEISKDINVNVPKYYGVIDVTDNKRGIILNNLNTKTGTFNINLNKNVTVLFTLICEISKMHSKYWFNDNDEIPSNMVSILRVNEITHYKTLITERYNNFLKINQTILNDVDVTILNKCYENFTMNVNTASSYPLSFCHGDFKSANIFYENNKTPYFLDWQYIQLNKGISDIVFLLVESIEYDERLVQTVLNYYYYSIIETGIEYTYETMMNDFKLNLQIFPFVVCVWFNSEDNDKLLDKVFPIRFMRNMLSYYRAFL